MTTLEFLRQFRVGPFALFDTTLSFILVYYLAPLLSSLFKKIGVSIPRVTWLLLVLPISVLAHQLIGQKTPLLLLITESQNLIVIALITFLTVLGLSKIRITSKLSKKKK